MLCRLPSWFVTATLMPAAFLCQLKLCVFQVPLRIPGPIQCVEVYETTMNSLFYIAWLCTTKAPVLLLEQI